MRLLLVAMLALACAPVDGHATPTPAPSPVFVELPRPVIPTAPPEPTFRPLEHLVAGEATYYCNADDYRIMLSPCTRDYPDGPGQDFYAAAGPALRIGDWRGRDVVVFGPTDFVVVRLIEWCACQPRRGVPTLLDLYGDAFTLVCAGSSGVCKVTIGW